MTRAHGIDISQHNGKYSQTLALDVNKKGDDLDFIILRTSLAARDDDNFRDYLKCIPPDKMKGAYHYLTYNGNWEDQADFFINLVQEQGFHFFALDFEPWAGADADEKKKYIREKAEGARQWLEKVSAQMPGKRILFYTNQSTYNDLHNQGHKWMKKWPLWIAQYWNKPRRDKNPGLPIGVANSEWKFYQYSADGNNKGKTYGVGSKHVDLNVYNGTALELRQWLDISSKKKLVKVAKAIKDADFGYTWLAVINAARKVDDKRFGAWLKQAGVDDVLANKSLLSRPYNGLPIERWPTQPRVRVAIFKQLGIDWQPDDGRLPAYTWQDVIDATRQVDGLRYGAWLKKVGVTAVLSNRTLLNQPYSGDPIAYWSIAPQKKNAILARLISISQKVGATKAAISLSGEQDEADGRLPAYTWQDVIEVARKVDNQRFGAWLKQAGVNAVLANHKLLAQTYSGKPIVQWRLRQDKKDEILKRLRVETRHTEADPPHYTWQDVIDITREVDDKRFGAWLKKANVDKVLADRTLLTQPYSGRPVEQWHVNANKKKDILKRLQAIPKPIKDPVKDEKGEQIKLNVTYISQYDLEAASHDADCGPTCLAMILRSVGTPQSNMQVDELYRRHLPSKSSKAYTKLGEMKYMANREGLGAGYNQYKNEGEALTGLRQTIRAGRPFVALINYGAWLPAVFNGRHYVVVTGFDEGNVYVHDPLFRNQNRDKGKFYTWSHQKFLEGWGTLDPPGQTVNVNFAYVYTKKTIAFLA